ncbi:MAG: hypothetical protein M1542_07570 [Thermotogae bacterium]|jgi:hypothetical protein|nr:hypothetical protein [Thermotogota bacterium]MCL5033083.1 hypothetical protein [Thermotogota bacterium]
MDIFLDPSSRKEVIIEGVKFVLKPWSALDSLKFASTFASQKEDVLKKIIEDPDALVKMITSGLEAWGSDKPITKENILNLKPVFLMSLLSEILLYNLTSKEDVNFLGEKSKADAFPSNT